MDLFSQKNLRELGAHRQAPCISFFMPTTRGVGHEDKIRWKNLVKEAEQQLTAGGWRGPEVKSLLGPARELLDNAPFWLNVSRGVAMFLSPELARSFRLPQAFDEQVIVADHFQVKPLLPLLTGDGRFYLLALSQKNVRLLLGTRQTLEEVNLQGVPTSFDEALRYDEIEVSRTVHTHPAAGGRAREAIAHGHGVGIDSSKEGLLEFCQRVDRGLQPLLRQEAPLVLAGVDYLLAIFRQANTYAHLMPQDIPGHPDRLSLPELRERAWLLVQPYFTQARDEALALYQRLVGTEHTGDDLAKIVVAARQGKIQFLLVAPDREKWGRLDSIEQDVEIHEQRAPGDEDLVNLAAVLTLSHKGTVYAVQPTQLPERVDLAAIFWLPVGERKSKRTISAQHE